MKRNIFMNIIQNSKTVKIKFNTLKEYAENKWEDEK